MWPYVGGIANAVPGVSHSFLPVLCCLGPILGIQPSDLWALVLHGGGLKSARRLFFWPKGQRGRVTVRFAAHPAKKKKFPYTSRFLQGFRLSEAGDCLSQPRRLN